MLEQVRGTQVTFCSFKQLCYLNIWTDSLSTFFTGEGLAVGCFFGGQINVLHGSS